MTVLGELLPRRPGAKGLAGSPGTGLAYSDSTEHDRDAISWGAPRCSQVGPAIGNPPTPVRAAGVHLQIARSAGFVHEPPFVR